MDDNPVVGHATDYHKMARYIDRQVYLSPYHDRSLGKEGVDVLVGDSTNATKLVQAQTCCHAAEQFQGHAGSELDVREGLTKLLSDPKYQTVRDGLVNVHR